MEKKIPLKNYIILAVTLIITVILVIYFYLWQKAYEESKKNTIIMDEYIQKINYNELIEKYGINQIRYLFSQIDTIDYNKYISNYLIENKSTVIYSSVVGSQKTSNFEKKFVKVIQDNSLKNSILYLDLTEVVKNKTIKKELLEKYPELNNNIKDPLIIIFNNDKVIRIYNIKDNNYNIDNTTSIVTIGYVGMNSFSQHYLIDAKITPKTYNKYLDKTMSKLIKDNIVDTVKKNESSAEYFRLDFSDLKNKDNYFTLEYYNDNVGDEDLMMNPSVDGTLKRYNVNYTDSGIDKKYISDLRKISNIIINAISENLDVEKDNLIQCSLSTNVNLEYLYDDDRISGYSMSSQSQTVYVNITDEQYDEINRILSKCSNHTNYVEPEN